VALKDEWILLFFCELERGWMDEDGGESLMYST
jgi:hypothetical protein